MKTLYLTGFSHHLCGSRSKTAATTITGSAVQLGGLAAIGERFIPASTLQGGPQSRNRCFPQPVVFWAFLSQILTRHSSCREAVRRVQVWAAAAGRTIPDAGTAGYCMARARLPLPWLVGVFERLGAWIEVRTGRDHLWCGRSVKVIDGTGVSMPDTDENRKRWPCAPNQKKRCGFPSAHLVGLFCLGTGRLVRFALNSFKSHELPMARTLIGWIKAGEVILADRGFCGFGFLALLQRKGVDVVVRINAMRKIPGKGSTMLWHKPAPSKTCWEKDLWDELPALLEIRLVRFRVVVPGFRTETIILATTLMDSALYSDQALAELYLRRWRVELFLRDIKVTMGLDVLRCQSPDLIEREIWMQTIAYNLVRALMLEASLRRTLDLDRLSFKGTIDTLRQWAPLFVSLGDRQSKSHRSAFLDLIADDRVPLRPNRFEPRVRKRRPKQYSLLTVPRARLRRKLSRGRTAGKSAAFSLI
jgi:hypothetical protein